MELHLYIHTKPVIYGQDMSLLCSFDVPNTTSIYSWYWFKNDRILYTGGAPGSDVDIDKYEENQVTENIRKLTITDFEFSDIQNYKCVHAFNEASLNLNTEADNFVCKYQESFCINKLYKHSFAENLLHFLNHSC